MSKEFVGFWIDPEVKADMDRLCKMKECSLSYLIRRLVYRGITAILEDKKRLMASPEVC